MKVLVCGGRYYNDRENVFMVLDEIYEEYKDDEFSIVHGACHIDYFDISVAKTENRDPKYLKETGADYFADMWCRAREIPQQRFPALWHKYGKSAGMKRNYNMFWNTLPNLCLAFEGGKGTSGMKKICYNANIPIIDIPSCKILIQPIHITDQPH